MGHRRQAREAALGFLYQQDAAHKLEFEASLSKSPKDFFHNFEVSPEHQSFCKEIIEGVCQHQGPIDDEIREVSERWKLERMARVDRCILRIGSWELAHTDTPTKVVVNECVEMAKKFSTVESSKFVNGLLDQIAKKTRPEGVSMREEASQGSEA